MATASQIVAVDPDVTMRSIADVTSRQGIACCSPPVSSLTPAHLASTDMIFYPHRQRGELGWASPVSKLRLDFRLSKCV